MNRSEEKKRKHVESHSTTSKYAAAAHSDSKSIKLECKIEKEEKTEPSYHHIKHERSPRLHSQRTHSSHQSSSSASVSTICDSLRQLQKQYYNRDNKHRNEQRQQNHHEGDSNKSRSSDSCARNFHQNSNTETAAATETEKQHVNMATTGKLAEDTNMFKGRLIKYNEPEDAAKPDELWCLVPFLGESAAANSSEQTKPLFLHRQSAFMVGRDEEIAEVKMRHPSISRQHAVIQFRRFRRLEYTTKTKKENVEEIRAYIIDLESGNGTFLNGDRIEPRRYVQLLPDDVLKFGMSSRDYVVEIMPRVIT